LQLGWNNATTGSFTVMTHSADDLLTVNEAAQILRVSATTVRNWASDGRLEEHRTAGGHRRFRASDVQRLARSIAPQSRPIVLIIDDDSAIRFVLREAYASVGFEVVEAESGLLGLDALDQQPPSLVLLDIMMPGIDGFQVMKYLSQFGVKVPVLAMSALGPRVEDRARELGADAFVAKPFDIRELVLTSRRLIEQHAKATANDA
jgi:excisionase family DNA binding protein